MIFLFVSCSKDGNEKDNDSKDDPWEALRDLKPGEIKTSGDFMCYYDCFDDEIFCGKREICDCDISKYHPDFFAYNCYFVTEGYYVGSPPYPDCKNKSEDVFGWVICFCGINDNKYSGDWHTPWYNVNDCEILYTKSPTEYSIKHPFDGICDNSCNECKSNCIGKECGPDGCGGSCGSCPSGEKCSAAGKCISESSGDPCTECLNSCRGLPGCCTGCGCICEDECGQCF